MRMLFGCIAGVALWSAVSGAAHAALFTMNGNAYQVNQIVGTGPDSAILELDFGTPTAPQPVILGFQWDPAVTPAPEGRSMLTTMQSSGTGISFTDTYFASFDSYLLNTLWDGTMQPPDDYPNSFWFWFTAPPSPAGFPTWTDSQVGYDHTPILNDGFYGWALQQEDRNLGRDPSLPPLSPSHFPAAISPVPEPGTLALSAGAAFAILLRRRNITESRG